MDRMINREGKMERRTKKKRKKGGGGKGDKIGERR